jgi:hypothetical protein
MPSPLAKYQRQPKQSIDLPSKGRWYAPGTLTAHEDLDVFSMTASDEIGTKTPDALLSGNATASIIKNCIPSIKNPWEIPMTDIYTILSAIRMSSYGETFNMDSTCVECSEDNSYEISIQTMIGHFAGGTFIDNFELENIKFDIRPLNFKELNEINKFNFKAQRRLLQTIPNITDEDERAQESQKVYDELANLRSSTVITAIAKVTIEGEEETNFDAISNFLKNSDKKFFTKAEELLVANNKAFSIPPTETVCASCGHKAELEIELDYSNFFAQG